MNDTFFLCFSDDDSERVQRILRELDYELKCDMSSTFEAFNEINDAVYKRIEEAEVFIVFISELSKSSYYVKECVVRALNLNKNIVPIEIEKHSLFSTLPEEFKFRDKPYSFFNGDSKAKLLAQLKSFFGTNVETGDSFGALVHIVTDRNSQIFRYGELLGVSSPGSDCRVRLKKGSHKLDFVDVENSSLNHSISFVVKDNDNDQFLEVNLQRIYEEKKKAEEAAIRSANNKTRRITIFLSLIFLCVAGWCIYQFVLLPQKIDREAPRYYPIVNVFLRSSQVAQVDFNKLGLIPYGSELITYQYGPQWSYIKVGSSDKSKRMVGYVASPYIVGKSDFYLLHGIFGDEESRAEIATAKCRIALLNYFKSHDYIGYLAPDIRAESGVATMPADSNQWQVFNRKEKPNNTYYKKLMNKESKFTDFAVIIKNIVTGERKLLYFYFDEDESPILAMEESAPESGYIHSITYNRQGLFTIQYTK